jgi:hypothetical protein
LNTPYVSTFNAPLTNEPYSKIFGDFNPIHVNPYFSDFASLPATITNGLWLSAATRYVKNIVAQGHPDHMIALNTPLTNKPYSRRLASFGPPRHIFLVRHGAGSIKAKRRSPSESLSSRLDSCSLGFHITASTVADLVAEEDSDHEELWEPNDLKIPVYNTENGNFFLHLGAYMLIHILIGSDMRELKSSVTRSLCDQILPSPIHWTGSGVQEMPFARY